jgi:hypothetical protein
MGKTVIGEMVMIWLAWKIVNTVFVWASAKLTFLPMGLRQAVAGGN